eukprot:2809921-Amphidinium_carterae.1
MRDTRRRLDCSLLLCMPRDVSDYAIATGNLQRFANASHLLDAFWHAVTRAFDVVDLQESCLSMIVRCGRAQATL